VRKAWIEKKSAKKKGKGLGRDKVAEPESIFLTACSGIPAPGVPSDRSVLTADINTWVVVRVICDNQKDGYREARAW